MTLRDDPPRTVPPVPPVPPAAAGPPLVGRAGELAALTAFVSGVTRHRAATLVVDGPAGSGKTALLRELVAQARRANVRVLTATGRLPEPLVAVLDDRAPDRAAGEPTLFVIDHAQRAPAGELHRLAAYVAQLAEGPVGIALAVRREEPASDPEALDELRHTLGAVVLRPRPIGPIGIRAVVERAFGGPADPAFVRACRAATRGNPFLLTEVLAELVAQHSPPDAAAAGRVAEIGPATVAQSIEALIAGLSPDALQVARTLAVFGESASAADVARLGVDAGDHLAAGAAATAADQLAVLVRATLVRAGTFQFLHPTVRRALYLATPAVERVELHRRTARILADRPGTDPGRLAAHLAAFGETMDPEIVETLSSVADDAAARGQFGVAARCLAQALPGTLSPTGRAETAGRLARYLERAGSGPALPLLRHAWTVLPDGPARVGVARALVHGIAAVDGIAAAVQAAERFGAAVAADAQVLGLLDVTTVEESRAAIGETPADAAGALVDAWRGVDRSGCVALARDTLTRWPLTAVPAGEQLAAALTLLYADEHLLLDRLLSDAGRRGEAGAELTLVRARMALRRGDVTAAGQLVDAAAAETGAGRQRPVALSLAAIRIEVLIEHGLVAAADAVLQATDTGTADGTWPDVHLLEQRGRLRLLSGDVEAGADDLRAAATLLARFGVTNPAVSSCRVHLALAGAQEGGEAADLARAELAAAEAWGTARAIGIAQRAVALTGDPADAIDLLTASVSTQAAGGSDLERARALVDLGLAHGARGDRDAGRDALRTGLDIAQRCGADALADRAHAALVAAGARPRRRAQSGVAALTASERRIVDLAAKGRTNRDVAAELFVTQRTVELHLTNAYRKLGITHRHELAAALAER